MTTRFVLSILIGASLAAGSIAGSTCTHATSGACTNQSNCKVTLTCTDETQIICNSIGQGTSSHWTKTGTNSMGVAIGTCTYTTTS